MIALLVRRFERLGDLPRDRQRFVERQSGPRAMRSASVGPSTSSSTSARHAVRVLEPVDGADVRMIERGEHLRFALKPREPLGIGRERVGQDLQRDVATELRVARAIHLAHPARAEQADDLVDAERAAGFEGHAGRVMANYTRCASMARQEGPRTAKPSRSAASA